MRVIDTGRDGFRARLNESMQRTGLKQSTVARRVGVERSAVNAWMKGRRVPPLDTTRKLAALFGWPTDEVLAWFGVYEPVAQDVNAKRQKHDAPLESGDRVSAAVTRPVTASPDTVGGPPDSEASVYPSPSRAILSLYHDLFGLSEDEVEELHDTVRAMKRRRREGREPKASGEGP